MTQTIKIEFIEDLFDEEDERVEGMYFDDEKAFHRRIQIEKNLPPFHKFAVVVHELIHYLICRIFGPDSILHKVLDKTDIDVW